MSKINYEIDVIVEIPQGEKVKYEWDPQTQRMRGDRIMTTSMTYPGNYGFIDNTISGDGDPIDVLIPVDYKLQIGTIHRCRVIGALLTEDEKGRDEKIIAVPVYDVRLTDVNECTDLPPDLTSTIEHFFKHYKDNEKARGKWVNVEKYVTQDEAWDRIGVGMIRWETCIHVEKEDG